MSGQSACGSITVFAGCMFAEKTTTMCTAIERHQRAKKKCVLIKHSKDTRFEGSHITNHRGTVFSTIETIVMPEIIDINSLMTYDVIGIDEGQFFKTITSAANKLADAGKLVYVAYLDATSDGTPFGDLANLVASAEHFEKLTAVCECGRDASFSKKTTLEEKDGDLLIGGADKFVAVCRACFKK